MDAHVGDVLGAAREGLRRGERGRWENRVLTMRVLLLIALLMTHLAAQEVRADGDPGAQREARLLYLQGVTAQRDGRLERAIDLYKAALATDSARLEARAFLALALDQFGQSEEAIRQYDLYLQDEPDDSTVRLNRVAALVHLQRNREALEALETLQVAPRLQSVLENLRGVALLRTGQAQNAAAAFKKALELDSQRLEPRVNLAAALVVLGERTEAAEQLRLVLSAQPMDSAANNTLGVLLAGQKDDSSAVSAFQLAGQEPEAELNLVTLLAEQGKLSEALLAVSDVVDRYPDLTRAKVLYAIMLYRSGRSAEAERELAGLTGFLPSLYRGLSALDRAEHKVAVSELRDAVLARPESAVAHHNLSLALAAQNELTEAVREAKEARTLSPSNPAITLQLGLLAIRQHRFPDAIGHLETYLKLAPKAEDRALVRQYLAWLRDQPRKR